MIPAMITGRRVLLLLSLYIRSVLMLPEPRIAARMGSMIVTLHKAH